MSSNPLLKIDVKEQKALFAFSAKRAKGKKKRLVLRINFSGSWSTPFRLLRRHLPSRGGVFRSTVGATLAVARF